MRSFILFVQIGLLSKKGDTVISSNARSSALYDDVANACLVFTFRFVAAYLFGLD